MVTNVGSQDGMGADHGPIVAIVTPDPAVARQMAGWVHSAGMIPTIPFPPAVPLVSAGPRAAACVVDLGWLSANPEQRALLQDAGMPLIAIVDVADGPLLALAADLQAVALLVRPVHEAQGAAAVRFAVAVRSGHEAQAGVPRTAEEKLRAIATILQGTPPAVLPPAVYDLLSVREREIVELLWSGARVASIARRLGLSPHTIRNHLKSVFRKLNVRGQRELFEQWQAGRRWT